MKAVSTEQDLAAAIEIPVSGLLFNMDGVLLSSTQGDERCWMRWAAHHGLSETFDLRRAHGRRVVDTLREHLPELTHDAITDHISLFDLFAEEEQAGIVAYPGVIELLSMLPSCSWTVVTSASETMMRSRLAAVGITAPKQAVGGDTVCMGKPHPEGYCAVLTC